MLGRGANRRLTKEAPAYVASHYYAGIAPGKIVNGIRCENLEHLSFGDEPFHRRARQDRAAENAPREKRVEVADEDPRQAGDGRGHETDP